MNYTQLKQLVDEIHVNQRNIKLILQELIGDSSIGQAGWDLLANSATLATANISELWYDGTYYEEIPIQLISQREKVHASSASVGGIVDTSTGTYETTLRRDGNYWVLNENNGDTNDFYVDPENPLIFEDIEQAPVLFWSGLYTGTAPHATDLSWRAYNFTSAGAVTDSASWTTLTFSFTEGTLYSDVIVSGFTSDHISNSNEVWIVPVHLSNGASGHSLAIDEIYLTQDNVPQHKFYKGSFLESFRNTGYDMAHGLFKFKNQYKNGSSFKWNVRFVPFANIADGETVVFQLKKSFASLYDVFPTPDIITATFTNDSTWRDSLSAAQQAKILSGTDVLADSHLIAQYSSTIDGSDLDLTTIGFFELIRKAGTYSGNVGVIYTNLNIEIDAPGSREELVK